jgi:WD40 repeat protein
LYCLKGHNAFVADLLFVNIDKYQFLLSGSFDCTIKVWDANDNYNCIRTIDTGSCLYGKFLLLKNGYFATTFYGDNKITIWDLVGLRSINTLQYDFRLADFQLLIAYYLIHLREIF